MIRAFEAFVDDLSNWYIRRSRRRFYGDDDAAFRTLWYALVQSLRVDRAGDAVPRPTTCGGTSSAAGRRRCILAGWPEAPEPDRALLDEIAEVRRVVELGRQARVDVRAEAAPAAAAARRRGRRRRAGAHADEIADELRVKEVEFGDGRGLASCA